MRGAKKYEQYRDEDVMLLIRIGNKMLLVWRCAPQEEEHIEKDEMLLVGRGAQTKEQRRHEDETLLVRVGYNTLLVWRCPLQAEEPIGKDEKLLVVRGAKKMSNPEMKI